MEGVRNILVCCYKQWQSALLLLTIILLSACQSKTTQQTTLPSVTVATVVQKQIPLYLEYVGNTESPWEVDIRARVEGFLLKQAVPDGANVKKGQLIFVIDPRPFQAKLAEAKAQLAIAIANREFYKAEAARMSKLVKEGAISRELYDKNIAQYKEAIGEVEKGQANVITAKLNLSYCWMYSPLDGRMGVGLVRVGNLVGGTTQTKLSNIVQLDPIFAYFSPPAKDLPVILQRQQAQPLKALVTLSGEDASLKYIGTVDFIDNRVTNTTSTIRMRAVVNNPNKTLLPGLFVTVKILIDRNSDAILIPQRAIMEGQNSIFVYVLDKDNKVQVRKIEKGRVFRSMQVIKSGLQPGERVITDGLQQVRPGMKVKSELYLPQQQSSAS